MIFGKGKNHLGKEEIFVIDDSADSLMCGELEPEQDLDNKIKLFKLFNEIQDLKYKEWKGEIKKKKPRERPISPRLRFKVLQRDNFTCQYCGRKAPEVVLEVDHIEPYSKTKNNDIDNLITSCKECNRGKRAKEII